MKKNNINSVSQTLSKRGAGRPKTNQMQGEELKEHVLAASSLVYSEYGYRDTSVAKIIKAAGISRPLFYRLFKSCYEVIDIIVARANEALFDALEQAMEKEENTLSMIGSGIDIYFEWCRNYGPVVGPIYREISDPESPAYTHRNQLMVKIALRLNAVFKLQQQATLLPMFIESLIVMIEHIGSSTFWPEAKAEAIIEQNKAIVRRIVMAAVANEEESKQVPSLDTLCIPD